MTQTTETPIHEMEAGREMDRLIVERVMGAEWTPAPTGAPGRPTAWLQRPGSNRVYAERHADDGRVTWFRVPPYSTDIAAAWLVVEAMREREPGWRFGLLGGDIGYGYRDGDPAQGVDPSTREHFGWKAEWHGHIDPRENYGQRHGEAYGDTAPLAICRAALLAVKAGGGK